MLEDIEGRPINIGDYVVMVAPGSYGDSIPGLKVGEVVGLTKASVRVYFVDPGSKRRKQHEVKADDMSQPPSYISSYNGQVYYHQVGTGVWQDNDPVSIRHKNNRFWIIGAI